jgi:signal transduction histidine kinase
VQSAIDRAFYPDRLNFQREINQAQAALARVVNRQEVIRLLTQELPPRIGVTWANLSLAPAPEVPGQPDLQPAWNTRLIVAGQPLGRYWLGPRRAGPSFDRDEQAQLQSLARQAALALAYADTIEELNQLNQELEERVAQRTTQVLSQQRALAVYEERQRLARNLHDSVTQALFSINLSARALRNLVRRDPSAAVNGLNDLEIAAQQALAEMRALLAQLRAPQGLDNAESAGEPTNLPRADLCAPLRQHCQALQSQPSPLHVEIDLPETLFLPAPQADDLLYIVREALHNIIKHSGSDHALCRIIVEAEQLTLAITDQGEGFDPQALVGNGYGLRGMQERAEALGGRLKINSQAGVGTAISIQIPYRSNL